MVDPAVRLRLLLASALCAALSGQALAAPVQGTTQATSTVSNSCTIVSADNLMFGAYSTINPSTLTTSGQIELHCTKNTAVAVSPTSGGSTMTGPGGSLTYSLYSDASLTTLFGQGGTASFTPPGDGFSTLFFKQSMTKAQFLADPTLATRVYGYAKAASSSGSLTETYYTGYLGQVNPGAGNFGGVMSAGPSSGISVGPVVVATAIGSNTYSYGNSGSTFSYAQYIVTPTPVTPVGGTYAIPNYSSTPIKGTVSSANTNLQLTYYGKLPAGQDVTPGSYLDTVVLTLTF